MVPLIKHFFFFPPKFKLQLRLFIHVSVSKMFPSHDLSCRSRSPPAGCVFPCKSTSCLESLSSASPCLPAPCFHPERRGRRGSSAAALRLWAGSPCRSLTSDSESHYTLVIHSALVSNNFLFLVLCLTSSFFFFFFPPKAHKISLCH